jgi:hypothetical protein
MAMRLSPEPAWPRPRPPSYLSTLSDQELRQWARTAHPLLRGMSWRRVQSHRRKWIRSVRLLGNNWLLTQR